MTALEEVTTLLNKNNIEFSVERKPISKYYDGYIEKPPSGEDFYELLVATFHNKGDKRIVCYYDLNIIFNEDQSFHSLQVIP